MTLVYFISYLHQEDYAEIVVVRHGQTAWNALGKCQVLLFFTKKKHYASACEFA